MKRMLIFVFLLAILLPAASAKLMTISHQFTENTSIANSSFKLADSQLNVETKNMTIPVQLLDWDINGKGILLSVNGTVFPLSREWGAQILDLDFENGVKIKVGLTHFFPGKPIRYTRIFLAIWD